MTIHWHKRAADQLQKTGVSQHHRQAAEQGRLLCKGRHLAHRRFLGHPSRA